jgi:hypothetical protein
LLRLFYAREIIIDVGYEFVEFALGKPPRGSVSASRKSRI